MLDTIFGWIFCKFMKENGTLEVMENLVVDGSCIVVLPIPFIRHIPTNWTLSDPRSNKEYILPILECIPTKFSVGSHAVWPNLSMKHSTISSIRFALCLVTGNKWITNSMERAVIMQVQRTKVHLYVQILKWNLADDLSTWCSSRLRKERVKIENNTFWSNISIRLFPFSFKLNLF